MSTLRLLLLLLRPLLLLLLLLTAVCLTENHNEELSDPTPFPEYDYNATFEYSFYSNSSNEDLENFQKQFITPHDGEEEEEENFITEGQQEEEATTTEKSSVRLDSAASFPVSLDLRLLLWTVMVAVVLNSRQL
ncbi:hypothetical protein FQA47_015013 [Oryzias melastigma]|uniref:Uncharacterized protein n=1 Tax=Oryzias melastigma TaxID=30732 RepID=A0A834L1F1_ORYME|nr:uncharacterized protein si:ch211-191i18.2 [Oryzias melastigma]XP_036070041.1 uncharacterized protein si:ch211-191i18.2 [Oryzias melastigma]XP_036070042.1 uncharacterized protein si:ch211-191i18.2 [Oryzias melastigma]KAF6738191.1 hypothetical protein FQA47_015013 [Oryzias melastigma]